ncbi:helix-turn-helix domain-containing protein [Mesonia maritima]|uniref:Transcriptional regulator with XRE-family HTH domain n=1 Tax=Mesonia maritima TaxID=1793873 RepID=A0ABU1K1Y3_9FLAO|nr:helix-turn-helix domain-containing protein [Mesonia maritima]MDR6299619.1 transcriptional regulator with XRE-family HTH domain [Mesonia maritima]
MPQLEAKKIKRLRNEKGYSQEKLAQKSGLGLRTIQRIEQGNSKARGETLRLLAEALEVEIKDLIEEKNTSAKPEEIYSGYLLALHLAPISVLIFPFINILVPWILWITKKNESKKIAKEGKKILNFQLTISLLFIFTCLSSLIFILLKMENWEVDSYGASGFIKGVDPFGVFLYLYIFGAFLYAYIIFFAIYNTIRISKKKDVNYFPAISFLKK